MKTYCIDWFEQELCECEGSDGYLVRAEDHERVVKELQSRLESLEQEIQEQARIIGMGAEREDRIMARVRGLERDCEELIKERDEREDVINELINQVLSDERKDWSSAYDFVDAVLDVECKMKLLEKDAARWNKVLHHVGADNHLGGAHYVIRGISAPENVMRGAVSLHFEKSIDTAMQANKGE